MPTLDSYILDQYGLDGVNGGGIKNVQRGLTTLYGAGITYIDVPVSEFDPNNSVLTVDMVAGSSNARQAMVMGEFRSSTVIRFSIFAETAVLGVDVRWELIEFQKLKSLQKGVITGTTNLTSVTISPVVMEKTMTIMSYKTDNSSNPAILNRGTRLTTATNLNLYTLSGNSTICYFVAEFE